MTVTQSRLKEAMDQNNRMNSELREMDSRARHLEEAAKAETARGAAANEIAATEVSNARERLRAAREAAKSQEKV